ncbi:Elongation factor 2 [Cucumispora dikerogammari]|nr:Elongation factor 2 [Cucumispora dikerogammari]
MVDLTMKKVQELMNNQTNIRNISVIAHVDHGKSTLTDCLVIKARIASESSGGDRYMDTRADEQERGITIKATAISMNFALSNDILEENLKQKYNGENFLINLIDSPGHVDFSSEVTAALRVTDGALVVIDTIDGICVQTETVMRQAIAERIRPTVVLNKIDRALLELNETKIDLAQKLRTRVEDFNVKLELNSPEDCVTPRSLRPEDNEFSFCSGLQGWGFTLRVFARIYKDFFEQEKLEKVERHKKTYGVLSEIENNDILSKFAKYIVKIENKFRILCENRSEWSKISGWVKSLPEQFKDKINVALSKVISSYKKKAINIQKFDKVTEIRTLEGMSFYEDLGLTISNLENDIISSKTFNFNHFLDVNGNDTYPLFYNYEKKLDSIETQFTEQKVCELLWSSKIFYEGDPFDPNNNRGMFKSEGTSEQQPLIVFILNPIYAVRDAVLAKDCKKIREILKNFKVEFEPDEIEKLDVKKLFIHVMKKWLPASNTLLEQIILNLPSPITSQKYRYEALYTGPKTDPIALSIRDASNLPESPVVMYVSKMIPFGTGRFIAFGRVFSGVLRPGIKVRIQGQDYDHESVLAGGNPNDLFHKSVQRVVVMMGRNINDISQCPAGNIIGLIGIDNELKKTGTIATVPCYNIKSMKFSVSPVVKYSIRPKNAVDLPKLKEGLLKLSKSDPLTVVGFEENGELTIAGAGELHLEISLNDLRNEYAGCEILVDEPLVNYMEGISSAVEVVKMAKSANKHNKIYMTCEPLEESIIEGILEGSLVRKDPNERAKMFREKLDMKGEWIKKLMFYGPDDKGANIVIDGTKAVSYLNEIKEFMRDGFRRVTAQGPLIGEEVRGVRFDLHDVALHADAIHRTGNQITAPMIAVIKGLIMAAKPILYEPVFNVEVNVSAEQLSGVTSTLSKRRGSAHEFDSQGARTVIRGVLPVRESFGFNADLLKATKGQANAILTFSHYAELPGDLDDEESVMALTVKAVRKRKGLGDLKKADHYFDKQ